MTGPDHVTMARAVYDATADEYARVVGTELSAAFEGPLDRAVLAAFCELVGSSAGRVVADVGCGTGRVASRGIDVVGVDVSAGMLAVARRSHPDLRFEEGRLTALPFADRSLVGAICWYSIIHTPPALLDEVAAELARVLDHEGQLLVAFQAGDGDALHRPNAHGTDLPLTSQRHDPDEVARALVGAGFEVHTRAVRQPALEHETTPQAFLLAHRAGASMAP